MNEINTLKACNQEDEGEENNAEESSVQNMRKFIRMNERTIAGGKTDGWTAARKFKYQTGESVSLRFDRGCPRKLEGEEEEEEEKIG